MGVTYGIKIAPTNDRYIAIAEKALEGMGQAASPGAFFVDLFPCREHIVRFACQLLLTYSPRCGSSQACSVSFCFPPSIYRALNTL